MLTIGASVFGVVKFSIKAHKTYITQTCKSKKIYNCAIVLSQIYDGTIAISQISYNIFYSKIFASLSLFSVSSSLPLSKTLQALLSLAHSGGPFMVWAWVQHGSGDGMGRGFGGVIFLSPMMGYSSSPMTSCSSLPMTGICAQGHQWYFCF